MKKSIWILPVILALPAIGIAQTQVVSDTVSALKASTGDVLEYEITLPADARNFQVAIEGGIGDADLYVRAGNPPTANNYDCRPYLDGSNEVCNFPEPLATTYYIDVRAYLRFSSVSLSVRYEVGYGDVSDNGDNASDEQQATNATWAGFDSYYASAIGQTGQVLLDELNRAAARNHNKMSYGQVWDALKYTDEDPDNSNNVILIYTGRSQSKQFSASGNNDPDAWNREHSWPKSRGFPSKGDWGYTDIHHLRPSDASVNSTRGNKDFDEGGTEIAEAPGNYQDSDSFEPRDEVKGDVARMMFYMDVRYNGNDGTGTNDLVLVDDSGTSGRVLGDLCTLYKWHNQDPVSAQEIERHKRIVERQGNRNPFVDNPSWANEIWGDQC